MTLAELTQLEQQLRSQVHEDPSSVAARNAQIMLRNIRKAKRGVKKKLKRRDPDALLQTVTT